MLGLFLEMLMNLMLVISAAILIGHGSGSSAIGWGVFALGMLLFPPPSE